MMPPCQNRGPARDERKTIRIRPRVGSQRRRRQQPGEPASGVGRLRARLQGRGERDLLGPAEAVSPEGRPQQDDRVGLFQRALLGALTPRAYRSHGHVQRQCFIPHPAFWLGATGPPATWVRGRLHVSILTRPSGRVQPQPGVGGGGVHPVSILTRPEGRVQHLAAGVTGNSVGAVSILTRPEGRVQHLAAGVTGNSVGAVSILTRPEGRVQRDEAANKDSPNLVSILTRPSGRVQQAPCAWPWCRGRVSILTRPSGRVQPLSAMLKATAVSSFQSSPGQKAGCNIRSQLPTTSSPPVSILTRPEGRVQHQVAVAYNVKSTRFNPHPARRPGATSGRSCLQRQVHPFQSSPGQKAGCNIRSQLPTTSSPPVSILTRPEGRVQPGAFPITTMTVLVSILTRPEGRVQLWPEAPHSVII